MEIRPTLKGTVAGISDGCGLCLHGSVRILSGPVLVSAGEEPLSAATSSRAEVLREVAKKFGTGEKISRHEFQDFVDAQNHGATTVLKVGQKVPDFTLPDQNSIPRRVSIWSDHLDSGWYPVEAQIGDPFVVASSSSSSNHARASKSKGLDSSRHL